jgi:hypothetical protein
LFIYYEIVDYAVEKITVKGKFIKVCVFTCHAIACPRYQNELPKKIKSRGKDAHLIHEELVQTMKWKQAVSEYTTLLQCSHFVSKCSGVTISEAYFYSFKCFVSALKHMMIKVYVKPFKSGHEGSCHDFL